MSHRLNTVRTKMSLTAASSAKLIMPDFSSWALVSLIRFLIISRDVRFRSFHAVLGKPPEACSDLRLAYRGVCGRALRRASGKHAALTPQKNRTNATNRFDRHDR